MLNVQSMSFLKDSTAHHIARWNHSNELQGIAWMLASCFWFATLSTLIRYLSADIHPFVMVFFRSVFALLLVLPWVLKHGKSAMKTSRFSLHMARSCTGLIGMLLFFSALSIIPLTQAISLSFTVPLFTTIAAILFLNEKVGWRRWGALVIGFAGALVIVRPTGHGFNSASLLVVAATCMWALSNISIKKLIETEYPQTMLFYMTLLTVPMSLPFALPYWQMPSLKEIGLLIVLGVASNFSQLCLFRAYSKTDVSVILPIDFSRLIFVAIMGAIFFGETIDLQTGIGAMIILTSTVYIARHEVRLKSTVTSS